MRLRIEVPGGCMVPKWYGIAHYRWDRPVGVAYVMPLHLVVGLWNAAYWHFRFPPWRHYGFRRTLANSIALRGF